MNKITILRIVFFVATALIFVSCDEFFEEDIEKDNITILSPSDGTETEIVTQIFWWNKIEGATGYRLQIVSPEFSSIEIFIVDTLVISDKFEITLYPADYEWRIRGENSAYQTEWTTAQFFIYSSDDLTRQRIRLRYPQQNTFTNTAEVGFLWDILPSAETYELKIFKDGWGQELVEEFNELTTNNLGLLLDESEIWWGVRAVNSTSQTLFSYNRFVVDRTKPELPTLISPTNNKTSADSTVVFTWNSNDPNWGTVVDSLFISEKSANSEEILFHKDAYTNKTATVKLYRGKTYTWHIQSKDQAGNVRDGSELWSITVND